MINRDLAVVSCQPFQRAAPSQNQTQPLGSGWGISTPLTPSRSLDPATPQFTECSQGAGKPADGCGELAATVRRSSPLILAKIFFTTGHRTAPLPLTCCGWEAYAPRPSHHLGSPRPTK